MNLNRADFDEYIHELSVSPVEKIIEEVSGDADLRGYLAATAGNIRNESGYDKWNYQQPIPDEDCDFCHFWETSQALRDWGWKDHMRFAEENDRKSIAYWAPVILRALDQRMRSRHSQCLKKQLDEVQKETEERAKKEELADFIRRTPRLYHNASVHDFTAPAWKKIVHGAESGSSYLIYGGNGIGKTHFGYAFTMKMLADGKKCDFHRLPNMLLAISTMASKGSASAFDLIDSFMLHSKPVLILDECDKISQQDTAFRNFSYLIDRRYEESLQTILLCNARSEDELNAKLGSSLCDRFLSKKWGAEIVNLTKAQSRREAGTEKEASA